MCNVHVQLCIYVVHLHVHVQLCMYAVHVQVRGRILRVVWADIKLMMTDKVNLGTCGGSLWC